MIDYKNFQNVFVAKHCARNASAQVWDDTATTTYIGAGELVITDPCGRVLVATDVDTAAEAKAIDFIKIYQRSENGEHVYQSGPIYGKAITNYTAKLYQAPVEQVVAVVTPTASLADFAYTLTVRRHTTFRTNSAPEAKSVVFKSNATGSDATIALILAAWRDEINNSLYDQFAFPVTATLTGSGNSTALIITANALTFDKEYFPYQQYRFSVEAPESGATITDNIGASLTVNAITYSAQNPGSGHYKDAVGLERSAKDEFFASRRSVLGLPYPSKALDLDCVVYQSNGSSAMQYDKLTIGFNNAQGDFAMNTIHSGNITLLLPVEDNNSYQAVDILNVLNGYITGWGNGVTQSLT